MLIEGQKVIDIIEGHKGFGINGILENIVEDIDNLCSDWEKMGLNINRRDDMTLDDAIIHAEEVASSKCDKCGGEHRQLAEWLKDYKRLLEQERKTDKALNLLAEWAVECDFGYDNIPEQYEKYKDNIADMGYAEGLAYIAKMESEE